MVGGIVVGISRNEGGPTRLNVEGTRGEEGQRLLVKVYEADDPIRLGDKVWWQSGWVFWTPQPYDGREDLRLVRASFSYQHEEP